jgi:hypothetical protein
MKVRALATLVLTMAVPLLCPALGSDKGNDKSKDAKSEVLVLHGAIEDSQCAFNVHSEGHSHEWMIKKNVPGASDEKSCTQHCVKDMGGVYVLVVKDEVYRLDDQVLPEQFAGRAVKVTATADAKPHTLRVLKIEEDK